MIWIIFIILISLAFVALALDYWLVSIPFIQEYAPNFFTEILGIAITVFVIEKLFEYEQNKDHARVKKIGLEKLQKEIWEIAYLLSQMIKSTLPANTKIEDLPTTYADILKSNLTLNIKYLDFQKNAPVVPRRNWFTHIYQVLDRAFKEIDEIVDTYIPFLTPEEIEKIEQLRKNILLDMLVKVYPLPQILHEHGKATSNLSNLISIEDPSVDKSFKDIASIISFFKVKTPSQIWDQTTEPKFGASRADSN